MKNLIYAMLFLFATSNISVQAQISFNTDMTVLHRNILKTCGMIKSKQKKDDAKIISSLASLKKEISSLQLKYIKDTPKEYIKDPLFGSYFFQLKDVVDILAERVSKGNYKAAIMNCSGFCKTFNKMHLINGTLDLTDVMFMWTMQMTITTNMIAAENFKGVSGSVKKLPSIYKKVIALKDKKNNDEFNKQFENIDKQYKTWLKAVNTKNYKLALELAKVFSAAFPFVFKHSL